VTDHPTSPAPRADAPARVAKVRTFHPRGARRIGRYADALARLWPRYGLVIRPEPGPALDQVALYGRLAPLVLEIGSGMGEATAAMAAADPDRDYLAVEVHNAGVAHLLTLIEAGGLDNVRVARGDALDLLRHQLPAGTLDAIHAFFPDPWPKGRHHKRRLIQPSHVALLRSRLGTGAVLHCATDWAPYAEAMRAALDADPGLANLHDGYAPRPEHRPTTRYERRGLAAGRDVFDLMYRRRSTP
jgi:tRNA (guanine-N7-)-methyltransferase